MIVSIAGVVQANVDRQLIVRKGRTVRNYLGACVFSISMMVSAIIMIVTSIVCSMVTVLGVRTMMTWTLTPKASRYSYMVRAYIGVGQWLTSPVKGVRSVVRSIVGAYVASVIKLSQGNG